MERCRAFCRRQYHPGTAGVFYSARRSPLLSSRTHPDHRRRVKDIRPVTSPSVFPTATASHEWVHCTRRCQTKPASCPPVGTRLALPEKGRSLVPWESAGWCVEDEGCQEAVRTTGNCAQPAPGRPTQSRHWQTDTVTTTLDGGSSPCLAVRQERRLGILTHCHREITWEDALDTDRQSATSPVLSLAHHRRSWRARPHGEALAAAHLERAAARRRHCLTRRAPLLSVQRAPCGAPHGRPVVPATRRAPRRAPAAVVSARSARRPVRSQ